MSAPDPGLVLQALTSYQLSASLKAAIDLEVFTHIAAGANTPSAIAPKCQASEKGVRVLCDYLTVQGFLTKDAAAGTYGLSPTAGAFLDKKSPAYLGSVAHFLTHDRIRGNFSDITAIVRKGGTVLHSHTEPEAPVWVEFARAMAPMMMLPAQLMAAQITKPGEPVSVLDIAAGHGIYGLMVAKHNPAATITAVDWPQVLEVAKENAQKFGAAGRYKTIPGSAFDVELGSGYDIVLLPNFLHHFDHETNVKLLKRLRAAMKPTGIVVTVEFVPNDDRVSPPIPAAFSMMMLGGTEHGDAYTFKELDAMFKEAGFGASEAKSLAPAPSTLIITKYA